MNLKPSVHTAAQGGHLCAKGTSNCLQEEAEDFCSTKEPQAGRNPAYAANTCSLHLHPYAAFFSRMVF